MFKRLRKFLRTWGKPKAPTAEKSKASPRFVYTDITETKEEGLAVLKNKGLLVVNKTETDSDEKTVIVLGVARSGTSMIAGALHHMGIFMGNKLSSVFEDFEFSTTTLQPGLQDFKATVNERNLQHSIWGWKRPDSLNTIKELEPHFRNPHYVVVFKDLFSIAYRNRVSMREDIYKNMESSLRDYAKLLAFLQETSKPCLLVSYDKALANKQMFIDQLSKFLNYSNFDKNKIAQFINSDSASYLSESRITQSVGAVTAITEKTISGWAKYATVPKTAEVSLYVNKIKQATVLANQLTSPVIEQELGIGTSETCGFEFVLTEALQPQDMVTIRVEGDLKDLPFTIQNAIINIHTSTQGA